MNRTKIIAIAVIAIIVLTSVFFAGFFVRDANNPQTVAQLPMPMPDPAPQATGQPVNVQPDAQLPQELPQDPQATGQPQETAEQPPQETTQETIVLAKGILLDFKGAGNDPQDIFRKSIAQKVVPAISWRNHLIRDGFPLQGFHTYMNLKREGHYTFKVVNNHRTTLYVTLIVNGVRTFKVIDTWDPALTYSVNLAAGVHEIRLFVSYDARDRMLPNFTVKFGLTAAEEPLGNHTLPNLYQLYYDINELTKPVSDVDKIFKFHGEPEKQRN
jgi:hypothetical protein